MTPETLTGRTQTRISFFRKIPGNIYAVVLLLVVFRFTSAEFLNLSNLLNIVQQGSILAIVSIGSFLAIVSHGIDLSLGPSSDSPGSWPPWPWRQVWGSVRPVFSPYWPERSSERSAGSSLLALI